MKKKPVYYIKNHFKNKKTGMYCDISSFLNWQHGLIILTVALTIIFFSLWMQFSL